MGETLTNDPCMAITGIQTLTVFVSDQDRAHDFYVDVLGMDIRFDESMGDYRWLEVGTESGPSLTLHKPFLGREAGGSTGIIVTCADLDAECDRLKAAGVDVTGPKDEPWGREAVFHDPDGNAFVLHGTGGYGLEG